MRADTCGARGEGAERILRARAGRGDRSGRADIVLGSSSGAGDG